MLRDGRELIPTAEGVSAHDAAAGPRRRGALEARADRRMGIQARADRARRARAQGVHAPDRRDDAAHRQEGEGIRPRHGAGRLRHARDPLSQLRRRGEGELSALCVHRQEDGNGCGFSFGKTPGRPHLRDCRGRAAAARQADRPARRVPLEGRLAVHGGDRPQVQRGGKELEARVRLRQRRQGHRRAGGLLRPTSRSGSCPKDGGRVFETRQQLCLRKRRAHRGTARADLRFQEPEGDPAAAGRTRRR